MKNEHQWCEEHQEVDCKMSQHNDFKLEIDNVPAEQHSDYPVNRFVMNEDPDTGIHCGCDSGIGHRCEGVPLITGEILMRIEHEVATMFPPGENHTIETLIEFQFAERANRINKFFQEAEV
jgi:hypothetical protein